ncbi:MAG: hypothetical protein ABSF78_08025 [Candidatus Acidiferrales bacterium]|jgi:hypothetical protein
MSEKMVMVGVIPEIVVLDAGEQAVWYSNAGSIKIEFDPQRCPFSSNVLQAPAGMRLASGPARPGLNPGSYRYRLFLNDLSVAQGEVLIRGK